MQRLKLSTEHKLSVRLENHERGNHSYGEPWPLSETFDYWELSYDLTTSMSHVACEVRNTLDDSLTTFVSTEWHKVRWAAYQFILNKSGRLRKVGASWVCDSSPVTVPVDRGCGYHEALTKIMTETWILE